MTQAKAILAILASLPDIIRYVQLVAEGVEAALEWVDGRLKLKTFDAAMDKTKKTGDTSDLENVFNPKPTPPGPPTR